jgi:glycosyltransferase involved in cell wall biosynthesis
LKQKNNITVTGWVREVQPYLHGAQIYIMPFRVGSGTRLKLIEAMATGKSIVSTTIGAEGYPVENGRELVIADEPADFAHAVLSLLEDRDRRRALGQAAMAFADLYDWRRIIPEFERVYARLLPPS